MKTFFIRRFGDMTEEEKDKLAQMNGYILVWLEDQRSINDIANTLGLQPFQVNHNIDEMLYVLRKSIGWKRYIKAMFIK